MAPAGSRNGENPIMRASKEVIKTTTSIAMVIISTGILMVAIVTLVLKIIEVARSK